LAVEPNLRRTVTCTTRSPRPGERDTVDYHFFSPAEFAHRAEAGQFLECANVYGNRYGTLKSTVLDELRAGHDVLLAIDVQGAASVRKIARRDPELQPALVTVFLTPPNLSELAHRLRSRAADSEEVIARRLATAETEIAEIPNYEYVVVSRTRPEDLTNLRSILIAERCRRPRVPLSWRSPATSTPTLAVSSTTAG